MCKYWYIDKTLHILNMPPLAMPTFKLLYNHSGPVNPAAEQAQGWKIVNGQIRRGRVSTNRWATDFLDLWFKHRSKTQVLDLRLDMLTPVSDIRQVYFAESYEKFSYFFQE